MKLIKISSMDVMVDGFNYSKPLNTVLDVSSYMFDIAYYQVLNENDQKLYLKNRKLITPFDNDESSTKYDATEGIINFYTAGWPESKIEMTIKALKYYLKEKNIEITSVNGPEQSGMIDSQVYRIGIKILPQENKNTPPELNLSNSNARKLFNGILSLPMEDGGTYDAWQVVTRIDKILPSQVDEWVSETEVDKQEGQATIIDMGVSNDYIKGRLQRIKEIAQWAIDNNYHKISVY